MIKKLHNLSLFQNIALNVSDVTKEVSREKTWQSVMVGVGGSKKAILAWRNYLIIPNSLFSFSLINPFKVYFFGHLKHVQLCWGILLDFCLFFSLYNQPSLQEEWSFPLRISSDVTKFSSPLRIWPHLLWKSLMKNFSFCAVDVLGSETRKHNTLNLNERTFEKSLAK